MNKYTIWYEQITTNARQRLYEGYTEKHHVIPKSLGGSDELDNLVELTAREHFICHWLLTKIYPKGEEHWKMINAFRMMRAENHRQQRYTSKITARVYDKLKKEYSLLQSKKVLGKNNPMYGDKFYRSNEGKKKQSIAVSGDKNGSKQQEARTKISLSKKGKKRPQFSEEWLANIKSARQGEKNGMYGKTHSEETRKKMSERAKGRKYSAEVIEKRAAAIRGSKREKIQCPHCRQDIAINVYSRWHGDNCKLRKEEG